MIVVVDHRDEILGRDVQHRLTIGGWTQFSCDLVPLSKLSSQTVLKNARSGAVFLVGGALTMLSEAVANLKRLTQDAIVAASHRGPLSQVLGVLRSGASDFLDLDDCFESQMKSIVRKLNSISATDANVVSIFDEFTPAQRRVAILLMSEASEREISAKLGVSYFTIHNHVKEIYRKCKVHSRLQLITLLRQAGQLEGAAPTVRKSSVFVQSHWYDPSTSGASEASA